MPRPRICDEPRVVTAVRLPASLRQELDRAAAERAVSVNFLVTRRTGTVVAEQDLTIGPEDDDRP